MLIAKAKRRDNIVEYILYMYQIEDIIRSLALDLNRVEAEVISKFDQPDEVKEQIRKWYAGLIREMKSKGLERSGHIEELRSLVRELQDLHQRLLTTYQDKEYQKLYSAAREELITLVKRSGGMKLENEIDVALNGMYGLLILRLKREKISEQTEIAMKKISQLLARLAYQFKRSEEGGLNIGNYSEN